jgi:hypothetical protein
MKSSNDGDGSSGKPPGPLSLVRRGPKELGQWWKRSAKQPLAETIEGASLAKALSDVGVLALAHLARRLCDPDTPEHVRDKIALSLGPKVMIQIGVLKHVEESEQAADLLGAYEESRDKLDS